MKGAENALDPLANLNELRSLSVTAMTPEERPHYHDRHRRHSQEPTKKDWVPMDKGLMKIADKGRLEVNIFR